MFTSGTTVYAGTSAGLFKSAGGGRSSRSRRVLRTIRRTRRSSTRPSRPCSPGSCRAARCSRASPAAASTSPPTAARPGSRRRPGNGMVRSETVWSMGSFKDNGALVYAATQSGIYISTDFGSTWTLSNDGISGITLRAWADDKYPNIYYAGRHRRPVPLDQRRPDLVEDRGPAGSARHDGPRDHAVQRHQREAHLRRHARTASTRARPTCSPLPGPVDVAQDHDDRPGQRHDRLGADELRQHARHADRRHAGQRRLRAHAPAADPHRRQADARRHVAGDGPDARGQRPTAAGRARRRSSSSTSGRTAPSPAPTSRARPRTSSSSRPRARSTASKVIAKNDFPTGSLRRSPTATRPPPPARSPARSPATTSPTPARSRSSRTPRSRSPADAAGLGLVVQPG